MAKRSRRGLSKKGLIGLKRVNHLETKERMWFYKGEYFYTLREIVMKYKMEFYQ